MLVLEAIAFYTFAALIIGFGVLVVTTGNPVHSALFLLADFLCVPMIYLLVAAEFLAVIQVLAYAGGIGLLYLIVVLFVNRGHQPDEEMDTRRQARIGLVTGALLLAEISTVLIYSAAHPPNAVTAPPEAARGGSTEAVGMLLYTDYLVPFEVVSMLVLVAIVGAIVLARKEG